MLASGGLTRDYFARAFKFCFVRNPWDRLVSLFFYLKQNRHQAVRHYEDFSAFCLDLETVNIPPVGSYNSKGLSQARPQLDWLVDDAGELFVDFAGRYESLDRDVKHICQVLGITGELVQSNCSKHRPYQEYYDARTRNIVAKTYRTDIEKFGYEF